MRNGQLSVITRDHSVVQGLIESGQITEEEARSHPRKNYITRAIGVVAEESGEYDELELESGDRLLLCTDGLTNEVPADAMAELLKKPAEEACSPVVPKITPVFVNTKKWVWKSNVC